MGRRLQILQVIHDFLPRHRAGAEIYAFNLASALSRRHAVTVLCAEYDPGRRHASLVERSYRGLPVLELINNWAFDSFEQSYRPASINRRLEQALDRLRPDVVHVHNLLSLSLDLPAIAARRGIPVLATLHDYSLLCPSGGQRLHVAERHLCQQIDPERCSRCFAQSPYFLQLRIGRRYRQLGRLLPLARRIKRRWPELFARAERLLAARAVGDASAGAHANGEGVTPTDIRQRLSHVERITDSVKLFVSPSAALADEVVRLGLLRDRPRVSRNGLPEANARPPRRAPRTGPLQIGFVGTLTWHKGPHVLLEAASQLPRDAFTLRLFGSLETAPDYVAALRRQARDLPVVFEGAFEESAAAAIYDRLDLLVVPSLWPENSPMVILEAQQAGVPVIGARLGGIPELVRHEVDGLTYEASSPTALAAALAAPLADRALLQRWAAALPPVKSIEDDASWWESIYHEALR